MLYDQIWPDKGIPEGTLQGSLHHLLLSCPSRAAKLQTGRLALPGSSLVTLMSMALHPPCKPQHGQDCVMLERQMGFKKTIMGSTLKHGIWQWHWLLVG